MLKLDVMGVHKFEFNICYAETDAGAVVYHGSYLRIMEYARMDLLRDLDLPPSKLQKQGLLFVISKLDIKFIRPLLLEDMVCVETTVHSIEEKRLNLRQIIKRGDEMMTVANVSLALVRNGQSVVIPNSIVEQFKGY